MDLAAAVKQLLPILTIVGHVSILVSLILYIFARKKYQSLLKKIVPHAFKLAFIVVAVATAGSLFYSDVAGFTPCVLCWYQRIFMYPQVILLGMAIYLKDKSIKIYSMVLASLGAIIAAIHYYEQITYNPLIPCASIGYSVSCTERFIMSFGYITIPMMALTGFVLILLLMATVRQD